MLSKAVRIRRLVGLCCIAIRLGYCNTSCTLERMNGIRFNANVKVLL